MPLTKLPALDADWLKVFTETKLLFSDIFQILVEKHKPVVEPEGEVFGWEIMEEFRADSNVSVRDIMEELGVNSFEQIHAYLSVLNDVNYGIRVIRPSAGPRVTENGKIHLPEKIYNNR